MKAFETRIHLHCSPCVVKHCRLITNGGLRLRRLLRQVTRSRRRRIGYHRRPARRTRRTGQLSPAISAVNVNQSVMGFNRIRVVLALKEEQGTNVRMCHIYDGADLVSRKLSKGVMSPRITTWQRPTSQGYIARTQSMAV